MRCSELETALKEFRERNGDLAACYDDGGLPYEVVSLGRKNVGEKEPVLLFNWGTGEIPKKGS